jgi:hypothetical protein
LREAVAGKERDLEVDALAAYIIEREARQRRARRTGRSGRSQSKAPVLA